MVHRRAMVALLTVCGGLLTGCLPTRFLTAKLTSALTSENSTVFTGEEDVELVRDALPFTMKLYETLLQRDSNNVQLLVSTGKLFALYAQAFVLFPADMLEPAQADAAKMQRIRAKRLFLRSRDYTLRAISITHPGAAPAGKAMVDSVLAVAAPADTALLYWCASAWLGAIAADRSDLALAMSVKRPLAMLRKVCELDSGYALGAAHELLSVCAAVTPTAIGGGEKAARFHFDQARVRSEGKKASPYVSFATSWCIKMGDRDEFINMLHQALDVDLKNEPSLRLQNTIVRQRAQWYLDNAERFFPPAPAAVTAPDSVPAPDASPSVGPASVADSTPETATVPAPDKAPEKQADTPAPAAPPLGEKK